MEDSVHLQTYPEVDENLIDLPLMSQMDTIRELLTQLSAARNKAKIKVRQPIAEIQVKLPTS